MTEQIFQSFVTCFAKFCLKSGRLWQEFSYPTLLHEEKKPDGNLGKNKTFVTQTIFFIAGIILQVWLTKDGIYHEEQFPPIKRRRNKHETREERKQRKYRYLYQVSWSTIFPKKIKILIGILHTYF